MKQHHYFNRDGNGKGWQCREKQSVFEDERCPLRFPLDPDCRQDMIGDESGSTTQRAFIIEDIGGMFRLGLDVCKIQVPILIPVQTCKTKEEAFDALCEWYDKTRVGEIIYDSQCELERHGWRRWLPAAK